MQIKNTKENVVWSYAATTLSMTASLIVLPFVLVSLNENDIGLYYIFISLSAISSVFDFGFSPTFAKNVAYCWSGVSELRKTDCTESVFKEPNYDLLNKVIIICKRVYLGISLLALFLLTTIGTFYIFVVSGNSTVNSTIWAWLVYAIGVFVNLLFGYYVTLLRGIGDIASLSKAQVASRTIQMGATISLLALGVGLMGVSVAYLVSGLVFCFIARHFFITNKRIKIHLGKTKWITSSGGLYQVFQKIWHNTWRDGVVSLSMYVLGQGSVVFCSLVAPLSEVGLYSLAVQIANALMTVSKVPYTTSYPALQSAYANRSKNEIKRILSSSFLVFFAIYCTASAVLLPFATPLIELIRPGYEMPTLMLALVLLYTFITAFRNFFTDYLSCTNRVIYFRSLLFSAGLSFVLMVVFACGLNLGIYGIIFAEIISQMVFNCWYWPRFVLREAGMSLGDLMKTGLLSLRNH